ncbi:MAG: extracellular solute-binding protein [Brachybacterium sp.]|nr:extracellular solute-binding protein [Brachybacterium sp.]
MTPVPTTRPTRRTVLAGALTATGLGLAGCGTGGRSAITLYQSKPEAISYFSQLAGDFNESQSSVRVVHDVSTNLSASFVRNNPPDVGCLNYNLEMARFMERGALSDLGDMEEASWIRDDVQELADQYATYEGRTSVLPYSVMAAAVIYNRQIFDEHGLEVPETWDQLIEVCETLQDADVTPFYGTFLDPWTVSQGLFDYTVGGMVDVADFFAQMHEQGGDVTPDSEISFSQTLREPIDRMVELLQYHNPDAGSRGYGDGNTAFANGAAAMYLQGPWALGEIDNVGTDIDVGTFPLPMTDDPADRRIRVNIDLSLWVPELSNDVEAGREFVHYLMQPEIQHPYNEAYLGFSTTDDAPEVTDERIAPLQTYYDDARFYMGPSQFIPLTIPAENYFQAIATGSDPQSILATLDDDWARLAYRQ